MYAPGCGPKRRKKIPPRPHEDTGVLVDSGSIPHEGRKATDGKRVGNRANNGRKKGTKTLKTIAKEAIGLDEFYKVAKRKQGGARDVIEMLFAKAIAEQDTAAAKIIVDKLMPNAREEGDKVKGDFGITINISDMKGVEVKEDIIEGEIIE